MTVDAQAEDLKGVSHFDKPVLVCNRMGPLLHFGVFHFDCGSAIAAHQVVVMGVAALPIHGLAVITHDDIYLTKFGKCLQSPIDRSESHLLALLPQEIV
jgi:hypothetical protein